MSNSAINKTSDLFDLSGRVAIITGGAGLLGSEYSSALAEANATVVIADIDVERAKVVANEVRHVTGQKTAAIEADVTDKSSVQRMVTQTLDEFGRIDILVNNAALNPKFDSGSDDKHSTRFEEFPLETWNRSLAVDLTGMFLCAQAVAPAMLDQQRGVIVNISSVYGMVGPDQRLYERSGEAKRYKPVSYSVTKSAALGLTRYLAAYWSGQNIRVNSLTLGGVFTDHDETFVERYSSHTTLRRMAGKSEYSASLLYLVSDASSYMTGSNLVVDGGWTAL